MKNKKDLVSAVAAKTGYSKKDITAVVDAVFESITDELVIGEGFRITGFGTFSTTTRAARIGHNIKTGESIQIPATKSAKFKPSTNLKDKIKENDI